MPRGTHSYVCSHTHIHTRVQGPIGALGKALFFQEQAGKPKLALCWMVVFQAIQAEASPTWAPSSGEPSTALSRGRGTQNGPLAHRFTEAQGEHICLPASCFPSYNRGRG